MLALGGCPADDPADDDDATLDDDDTGSLTVPAQLIDAYLYGLKHFLTLTRYSEDVVTIPGAGQVTFEVGSAVTCIVNEEHTPW